MNKLLQELCVYSLSTFSLFFLVPRLSYFVISRRMSVFETVDKCDFRFPREENCCSRRSYISVGGVCCGGRHGVTKNVRKRFSINLNKKEISMKEIEYKETIYVCNELKKKKKKKKNNNECSRYA